MELTRVKPSRVVHSSEMDYFNLLKVIALNRHDGFIRIIKESKEGHILFREGEEIAASYVEYIENKLRGNGEKLTNKEYFCENAIRKIENNIANKNDYIIEVCEFNTSQIDFATKLNRKYLLKPLKEDEKDELNPTLDKSPKAIVQKSISVQKPSKIEIDHVPANHIQNNYELLHDTKDSSPDFKKVVEAAVSRSQDKAKSVYGDNSSFSQDSKISESIESSEVKSTFEKKKEVEKSILIQKSESKSSIKSKVDSISRNQVKNDSELSENKKSIDNHKSEFESGMELKVDSVSADQIKSDSEALSNEEPLLDYRAVIKEAVSRSRDKAESVYRDNSGFSQDSKVLESIELSEVKSALEDKKEAEKPISIQESESESDMELEPDLISADQVQSDSEPLSWDKEPIVDYKTVIEAAVSRSRDKAESVYGDNSSFSQDSKVLESIELSEVKSALEEEKEVETGLTYKFKSDSKKEELVDRSDLLKKYGIKEIDKEKVNGLLESYSGNGLSSKEIENMEIALVNKIHQVIMSVSHIKKAVVEVFIDNSNELGGMVDIIIEYESKGILGRIRGVSNDNIEKKTIEITQLEIKKIFKNYPEAVKNFEINVELF